MKFRVLGSLEVLDGTATVSLGGRMQRTVLSLLLVHLNEVVATDRLIDELWGESPPETAHKTLQTYIYRLRKVLGSEVLTSRGGGYVLEAGASALDANEFERLTADAANALGEGRAEQALEALREALDLWRGRPFEDLAYEPCLQTEIRRLEELHLTAIENRIEAELQLGRPAQVVAELDALGRRYPLRERLRYLHMVALYRSGRQAEALRTYQHARRVVADELGLELSPALQQLEQRILDQDPTLDTDELVSAPRPHWAVPEAKRNPYKGLRAFGEGDAADFFGRADLVRRLLERLAGSGPASRMLTLVGPSGSGKSSLVRAGLIPALKTGAIPGSTTWTIIDLYPGGDPFRQLAEALTGATGTAPGDLERKLLSAESTIGTIWTDGSVVDDGALVVVIDQFEELFTLVESPDRADRFLDLLVATLTEETPVRIVLTIRADYLDRPLQHATFARLLEQGLIVVTPLSDHEVQAAITQPAARVGVAVEPELVAEISRDVATRAAALPLLQYALTDLFDRRRDDVLTLDAYRSAGGILGALSQRASDLYDGFDQTEQDAARQLFLRLVKVTQEGTAVRRLVTRYELAGLPVDQAVLDAILIRFGQHRLLTFDRHPVTGEPTVEVAHEALLTQWTELRGWIEQQREALLLHGRFTGALDEWHTTERDPAYLLRGGRLVQFETWADSTDLSLTAEERDYLAESRSQEDADRTRSRRRRQGVMGGFALAAIIAGVFAVVALIAQRRAEDASVEASHNQQLAQEEAARADEEAARAEEERVRAEEERDRAEQQAALNRSQVLAAASIDAIGEDDQLALLLGLEAAEVSLAASGEVLPEAVDALHRSLRVSRLEAAVSLDSLPIGRTVKLAASSSGLVAVSSTGDTVELRHGDDIETVVVTLGVPVEGADAGLASSPAFTPDGASVAVVGSDGTVRVWDVESGTEIWSQPRRSPGRGGVVYSPDGGRLLSAAYTTVVMWDAASGEEIWAATYAGGMEALPAFSPNGTRLAVGTWGSVELIVLDAESGEELSQLDTPTSVGSLLWSADGTRLFVGLMNGDIQVVDSAALAVVDTWEGHSAAPFSMAIDSSGTRLATGADDGTVRIWDLATGGELMVLGAGTGWISGVAFLPRRPASRRHRQRPQVAPLRRLPPRSRRGVSGVPGRGDRRNRLRPGRHQAHLVDLRRRVEPCGGHHLGRRDRQATTDDRRSGLVLLRRGHLHQ